MRSRLLSILPILFGASLINSLGFSLDLGIVIFGIGMLIFVHELGHFLIAKREKVRVEQFALGFGPAIIKKQVGETEYRINILFFLGGYVKMAGETPDSPKTGAEDEFLSKTPGARARIAIAGVTMNFIFGLLIAIIAFYIGIQFSAPIVGGVYVGSPAWNAGLQRGDEIVEIDGHKIKRFQDILAKIAFSSRTHELTIKFKRGDEILSCKIIPEYNEEFGILQIGVEQSYDNILKVLPNSKLYEIGLRTGDSIIEIEGNKIKDPSEVYSVLSMLKDKEQISLVWSSEGQEKSGILKRQGTKTFYRLGIVARQLMISAVRESSTAEKIGLQKGDRIILVDQQKVHSLSEVTKLFFNSNRPATITIERQESGKTIFKEFSLSLQNESPEKFWENVYFAAENVIGEVVPNMPAFNMLLAGDKIIQINDTPIKSWQNLSSVVSSSKGDALKITVERDNTQKTIEIKPLAQVESEWEAFGFLPKLSKFTSRNLLKSCQYAFEDTINMIGDIFTTLRGIFSQNISAKNLGGPVLIFKASYSQLQQGLGHFLYFLALISINLAVINLFPIPVLDGGLLVFLLIEKIRGKPIPEKFQIAATVVGVFLLLSLIIFVTFNDIARLF